MDVDTNATATPGGKPQPEEVVTGYGLRVFYIIQFILLVVTAFLMLENGDYGWTLFLSIPFSIGMTVGVHTVLFRTRRLLKGFLFLLLSLSAVSLALLAAGLEGAICVLMAAGIIGLPALIGLAVGYLLRDFNKAYRYYSLAGILMLNGGAYVHDQNDESRVISTAVESVEINASKEKIWEVLTGRVAFRNNENFFFRSGISYPHSMEVRNDNGGCFLVCETNNGLARLKIAEMDTLARMRFTMPDTVLPMRELSFYKTVDAAHLHGYFIPSYGEFEIKPVDGNRCRLVARTAYSYKITPVFYWGWWSDYLINAMHRQVLNDIRTLAEK
jgi:hypothetical protein